MTPDESVAEVAKLAEAAETIIGNKWTITPGDDGLHPDEYQNPGSQVCYLPSGDKGTNYPLLWMGDGMPDPEKAITEIQAAWEKLGVKATITKVGQDGGLENAVYLDDPPHLTGTYPDGYSISLVIATNRSGIDASTHCIPIPEQYLYRPGDDDAATPKSSASSDVETELSPHRFPPLSEIVESATTTPAVDDDPDETYNPFTYGKRPANPTNAKPANTAAAPAGDSTLPDSGKRLDS